MSIVRLNEASLDLSSRVVIECCKDMARYKLSATGYRCEWFDQDLTRRPMILWYKSTAYSLHCPWYRRVYIRLTDLTYAGAHDWSSYSEYNLCISKVKHALTRATGKGQYLRASLSSVLPAPCNYSKLSISNASGVSQLPSLRFVALPHRIFLSYIFFWNMAEAWELSRLGKIVGFLLLSISSPRS
jgi:hypothetical protein